MLNDRVRAGEHQAGVTVVETHQVGRLPARSADLDDLACPLWMAHDIGVHVEPVPDDCVGPTPRSQIRMRTRSGLSTDASSTFEPAGNAGCTASLEAIV